MDKELETSCVIRILRLFDNSGTLHLQNGYYNCTWFMIKGSGEGCFNVCHLIASFLPSSVSPPIDVKKHVAIILIDGGIYPKSVFYLGQSGQFLNSNILTMFFTVS